MTDFNTKILLIVYVLVSIGLIVVGYMVGQHL